jgi:Flp pilus assembly protein TadD
MPLLLAAISVAVGAASPPSQDEAIRLNNEGVECLGRGEVQEAIVKLEAARRAGPANATVAKNLACAYLRRAEALIGQGQAGEAIYWLDKAISLGVRDATITNNLAACYNDVANAAMRAGRYGEAAGILQTSVGLKPGSAVLRNNLGFALYRDNRRLEALDEFRAAVSIDPQNARARKMCGLILYWRGQMEDALKELKVAASLNPSDKEVQSALEKIEREYLIEKEFDVDTGVNFTVSFDGQKDFRIGRAVIDILDEAWVKVGQDLNFYPREKIAVVIYSGRQFRELLDKPKRVGGLYDGKIRVPTAGLDTDRDRDKLRTALMHEYAHGVVHFLTHGRCPVWLNEGIAEYESEEWGESKEERLRTAAEKGDLIPLGNLSDVLNKPSSPRVGLAYYQAFSIVKLIADRYGVYILRRILDNIDAGDAIGIALNKAIPVDLEGLEAEWRKSLQQ